MNGIRDLLPVACDDPCCYISRNGNYATYTLAKFILLLPFVWYLLEVGSEYISHILADDLATNSF